MKKYLVLSFDDGTIYDRRFIELLNKYNLPATLNLNSGLGGFVWYYDNYFPVERLRLEEMMREMNRSKDITPQNFRGFEDFSSMNINETPTNDEIVAALRVLQKAGLNGMVGTGDLSLLSGNSQQAQIMNMLGGSSMNSQLIQSLLTNNMSLGF